MKPSALQENLVELPRDSYVTVKELLSMTLGLSRSSLYKGVNILHGSEPWQLSRPNSVYVGSKPTVRTNHKQKGGIQLCSRGRDTSCFAWLRHW